MPKHVSRAKHYFRIRSSAVAPKMVFSQRNIATWTGQILDQERNWFNVRKQWIWTTIFDTATWAFLKFDMGHETLRAIPIRRSWQDRRYNPVGMAYLLGDWATDRPATTVAGRLGTADLYQACLIFHRRLVARGRPSPGDESARL